MIVLIDCGRIAVSKLEDQVMNGKLADAASLNVRNDGPIFVIAAGGRGWCCRRGVL